MAILVFNPGSTTLKWSIFAENEMLAQKNTVETWDLGQAARALLEHLPIPITKIGCRVVHGGREFKTTTQVTWDVVEKIRKLGELAPLHNYGAAAVLEACLELAPNIPTYAVFDTAFHTTLPAVARTYALPFELADKEDLYRYGFHGIAHQAMSMSLKNLLTGQNRPSSRLITCQLGGGASICAILEGKSVDTSMGLTPLEGVMMATRSGDIDPGILLYLLRKGWDESKLDHLLSQESGLKGVSGGITDPRALISAHEQGNQRATLALELYAYRAAKTIAGFTVPLGGLDGIAFSGGVGQNSAFIRQAICRSLAYLGVLIDQNKNINNCETTTELHASESAVGMWAIPGNEELLIAREIGSL